MDVRAPPALYIFQFVQRIDSSYKDFSECFPLWCEEQPNGAEGVFKAVSSFIETHIIVRPNPPSSNHFHLSLQPFHRPIRTSSSSSTTSRNTSMSYMAS